MMSIPVSVVVALSLHDEIAAHVAVTGFPTSALLIEHVFI